MRFSHSNVKQRAHFLGATGLLAIVLISVAASGDGREPAGHADTVARASAPRITKLEPPNWWAGFTPEIEVMASGENLDGAKISSSYPGVSIVRSKVTDGGRYLFAWVQIGSDARPGDALLDVQTRSGSTSVHFPFEQRGSGQGKFQGFSQDDVIYLIMPDRFADGDPGNNEIPGVPGTYDRSKARAYHGGDLRGIREHLDYLRDLGVTTIWLTPIVENDPASPQDYHGYGAVDEYAVEEHFGTLQDLQDLVGSAHAKGLKLILDFVPNHVGPRHPWVDALPEPDWFHGTKQHHTTANGNFRYLADPHAPPRYWRDVVEGWFAGILPDLNQENPDVAQYFIQNALWWAEETGIDGYRLDTFPYVSRRFWSEWHQALRKSYPHMTTVGEIFDRDPDITSFFAGGRAQFDGIDSGVTTVFDYPLYFALRGFLNEGAPTQAIVDVLAHDRLYPHPEVLVPFLGNHDVTRLAGLPGMSAPKLKLAYSLLLTLRGIPELYYGDEIGMTGGGDPDNRRDFPGGFPGDAQNAFLASGRTAEQQELFSSVQRALALRREHPALRGGQLWNILWNQAAYAFARTLGNEQLLIVMNTAANSQQVQISFLDTPLAGATRFVPLLVGNEQRVQDDRIEITIPAEELQIFSVTR
jgi:neopullulanase